MARKNVFRKYYRARQLLAINKINFTAIQFDENKFKFIKIVFDSENEANKAIVEFNKISFWQSYTITKSLIGNGFYIQLDF